MELSAAVVFATILNHPPIDHVSGSSCENTIVDPGIGNNSHCFHLVGSLLVASNRSPFKGPYHRDTPGEHYLNGSEPSSFSTDISKLQDHLGIASSCATLFLCQCVCGITCLHGANWHVGCCWMSSMSRSSPSLLSPSSSDRTSTRKSLAAVNLRPIRPAISFADCLRSTAAITEGLGCSCSNRAFEAEWKIFSTTTELQP